VRRTHAPMSERAGRRVGCSTAASIDGGPNGQPLRLR
jgi:hypothetical protein